MSISAIGSSSIDQVSVYAANQQRMKAFKTLSSAVQSGDLADAQKALATIQQGMSGMPQNTTGKNSIIGTDFTNLADAINSGDVAGAQKALATLQKDMQKIHGHHHGGHHGGGGTQATNATQTNDSTTADSTTTDAVGSLVNIQA